MKNYFWRILIAWDQLLNTLLGGWADETISARAYRMEDLSKWWLAMRILIDLAFAPFEADHCYRSYANERNRKHLPQIYRTKGDQ